MNAERNWGAVGSELQREERVVQRKVAILGHSFVRDLPLSAGSLLAGNSNRIILRKKFFVPGATVPSIQGGRVWNRYLNFNPDLTFLLIGGNDISSNSSPPIIARSIINLAKKIKELTRGEVKIITVERRPVPRGITASCYNRQRTSINRYLKHRDSFTKGRIVFSEARDSDSQDGVHLRESASCNLVNNIEWHIERFAVEYW